MADFVGYLAAILGTVCWLPQAWKAWTTQDTSSLSLPSILMFLATVSLWLSYGLLITSWPLISANVIAVVIVLAIVVAKLKFK